MERRGGVRRERAAVESVREESRDVAIVEAGRRRGEGGGREERGREEEEEGESLGKSVGDAGEDETRGDVEECVAENSTSSSACVRTYVYVCD